MKKKKISKNKKAIYFTLITILFLSIFAFYFTMHSYYRLSSKMGVVETRLTTMDDLIRDIERDIERGLYISSFRAIVSMQDHITEKGEFLASVDESFKEAIMNGTIEGEAAPLMTDSMFNDWINKIISISSKMNIIVGVMVNSLVLEQKDPWSISVIANVSMGFNDSTNIAFWGIDKLIESRIDIAGFEDPLYVINSYGRISNQITKTPFEGKYVIGEDISNLQKHMESSYYTENGDAPSFISRFENDLSSSENGIESMINLGEFLEQGIPIESGSVIDHVYWSDISTTNHQVNSTLSWFKLDEEHLEKYNASGVV